MEFPALTLLFGHLDSDGAVRPSSGDPEVRARDVALAARLASGDERAFDEVFRYHFGRLTSYVRRFVDSSDVAEDLAQDALVQLWERRASVRPYAPLAPLLRTIARRAALNRQRHARLVTKIHDGHRDIGETPGGVASHADSERRVTQAEIAQLVQDALHTLSPRVRLVAVMRWMDELGRQDIAAELGVSVRTVDAQLYQAAARIRAVLTPYLLSGRGPRTSE